MSRASLRGEKFNILLMLVLLKFGEVVFYAEIFRYIDLHIYSVNITSSFCLQLEGVSSLYINRFCSLKGFLCCLKWFVAVYREVFNGIMFQ